MTIDESIWIINFLVTGDGNDLSEYVVKMEYKCSMCSPGGHLELEVAPDQPYTLESYQDIVVYINDVKVFTGYTQNNVKARLPTQQSIFSEDAISKVRDTWNTDPDLESRGEPIEYWLTQFFIMSKVDYIVTSGGPPTPAKVFGITNVLSEVRNLMKYVGWQIVVDEDNIVQVQNFALDEDEAIDVNILSYERILNDHWLRNRAIVLGRNEEASVILDSYVEAIDGETRTAIVASPEIVWPGTAYLMAWYILNEFSTPWDVRTIECTGNPNIRIAKTVHVVHNWNDDNHYGLVTSLRWTINKDTGYTMQVTLDEKCPSYWLSDSIPNILYCATEEPEYGKPIIMVKIGLIFQEKS